MNLDTIYEGYLDRPVQAVLIGAGYFGDSLANQISQMKLFDIPIVCDPDVQRIINISPSSGYVSEDSIRVETHKRH